MYELAQQTLSCPARKIDDDLGRKMMNIPLDEWSGSKATKELEQTIERIQRKNAWPQRWMLLFSAVAAIAAVIAAFPVVKEWLK